MDLSALNSLMLGAMDPTSLGPTDMREGFLLNYPLAVQAEKNRLLEVGMHEQLVDRLAWMGVVMTTAVNGRTEDSADIGTVVSATFDTENEEWRLTRNDKVFLIVKTVADMPQGAWMRVWSDGSPIGALRAEMEQMSHMRLGHGDFLEELMTAEYLFALSEDALNVFRESSVDEDLYCIQVNEVALDPDPHRFLLATFPDPETA